MNNFEDTGVAFARLSNFQLRRAYILFKSLQIPFVFKMVKGIVKFCFSLHLPLGWIVKPTVFRQFCGGVSLKECIPLATNLAKYNVKSILDYSAEDASSDRIIEQTIQEISRTINLAAKNENITFTVFKPTALCPEDVLEKMSTKGVVDKAILSEADKFISRVDSLCRMAFLNNVPIMIDAEDFAFQNFVDSVTTKMMEKYNKDKAIVYNTLQMYRTDRLEFLDKSLQQAIQKDYFLGIKLVRGAYMERERLRAARNGYASPIWSTKAETDKAFDDAQKYCIENIDRINLFSGTHNAESCGYLATLMQEKGLARNDSRVYFSQLYGMSDNISFNLAKHGYNVAKYIPYGPVRKVLPYLIRRAEENSSVAGQTDRELMLIKEELKRRKPLSAISNGEGARSEIAAKA
jgi:proline dehydrogenase